MSSEWEGRDPPSLAVLVRTVFPYSLHRSIASKIRLRVKKAIFLKLKKKISGERILGTEEKACNFLSCHTKAHILCQCCYYLIKEELVCVSKNFLLNYICFTMLCYFPLYSKVNQLFLLFSCSVVYSSLWPREVQHARLPCPWPSPRVCSNSCPLSWPYVYIYTLFFGFPSHLGNHRALSRASCAIWQFLINCLFIYNSVYLLILISPTPFSPLGVHVFFLYICVSLSPLQIGWPVH